MKLRVGLIGLGPAWETRHRPALKTLSECFTVRAVCDEVTLRAAQAARQFDVTAVDGYRALVDRADVDAILFLAPQWYGPLPLLAACEAGKAVYCAAALAMDPVQARQIRDRVEQSGVAFMAEFPRRFAPATLRLKELIATQLGRPRLLFCHHRLPVEACKPSGHVHDANGPAMRALLELVDWCRYVVGQEPTSVVGVQYGRPGDETADSYQMMSIDFSSSPPDVGGPTAQVSCGHYIPQSWHEAIGFRPPAALQICCENGIAFVDLPSTLVWFDEAGRHMESLESERQVGEQLLLQFHRAVTSLVRNTSSLEDAYRAVRIVSAGKTSFREGRRVELDF